MLLVDPVVSLIFVAPVTSRVPPTFTFSAIPTPPVTLRAPVVLDEDVVLLVKVMTPSISVFPLEAVTLKLSFISKLPVTSNVPTILELPVTLNEAKCVDPETLSVLLIIVFPSIVAVSSA